MDQGQLSRFDTLTIQISEEELNLHIMCPHRRIWRRLSTRNYPCRLHQIANVSEKHDQASQSPQHLHSFFVLERILVPPASSGCGLPYSQSRAARRRSAQQAAIAATANGSRPSPADDSKNENSAPKLKRIVRIILCNFNFKTSYFSRIGATGKAEE